ncbi:hypothetical protein MTO96_023082 [Rhipicephalus appendiculatus]
MPAPRVTRPTKEPVSPAWNISVATPPDQRHVIPPSQIDGDECVSPLCLHVASTLRSKLDFGVDPCNDFYKYVCGKFRGQDTFTEVANSISAGEFKDLTSTEAPSSNQSAIQKAAAMYKACVAFASSYLPETIELVRWMIDMNLDFVNTTRLETVDPVEMMVRGSLDLGVEAIISIRFRDREFNNDKRLMEINYSKEQETWLHQTYDKWRVTNENYYGLLFLMWGIRRGQDLVLAKKMLAYEEYLRHIEKATVNWEEWQLNDIAALGFQTFPYVTPTQWGTFFYKYTERTYGGSDLIVYYQHSTSIIKKLFEEKYVGKFGLQYLVAWSIYRQLAEFTEPYLFRGDRTAEDSCFVHVRNVMNLAMLSHHFQPLVTPEMIRDTWSMAFQIKDAFMEVLNSSSWLNATFRASFMTKLDNIEVEVGSPGNRLDPGLVEKFYEPLPDVPVNRLFPSWIQGRRLNTHYKWKNRDNRLYDEETVNAFYKYPISIVIPTAIVQRPYFYENGPEALNYGGLGMLSLRVLQEELSHTVDSENLADFVGTRLSYAAYSSLPEEQNKVNLAGFDMSSDQLFFINQCATWCAWGSKPSNLYAPDRSRCIVPLRNMPEFSRAFGCAPGTLMNPREKCTFW